MENFLDLLKRRRSSRLFTGEPVDKDMVCNLMKAALMSPSGHRINPWEFILVDDKATLKALSMSKEHGSGLLEGAAMAVVVVADTTKTDVWIEDCSIATIIVQLAAEDNVRALLNVPEHYAVLSIVGLGHKARETQPFDEENMQWDKVHIGGFDNE